MAERIQLQKGMTLLILIAVRHFEEFVNGLLVEDRHLERWASLPI